MAFNIYTFVLCNVFYHVTGHDMVTGHVISTTSTLNPTIKKSSESTTKHQSKNNTNPTSSPATRNVQT